jgi:hypothetical protein
MTSLSSPDLFFRSIVRNYIEAPRFLRRDWLAQDLEACFARPGCRFAVLAAEPGAGMSAFVAQLASDHEDWLVFFIRQDQRTSLGEIGVRSFLLRTGLQLAAVRPELFALEQIRIEVEQRIGAVEEGAAVVAAKIRTMIATPFHQSVLRIKQEIEQARGSVGGILIDEWITDPSLIAVDDLQQMALFHPARILARLQPDRRIVILVDGLDELRYREREENLLDWLTNCPPIPENVRILLTSRPPQGPLQNFIAKRRDSVAMLPLRETDDRVQDDMRTYAAHLVAPAEMVAALVETRRTRDAVLDEAETHRIRDAFLDEVVSKAAGNIGYLAALGRAIDQALASAERRPLLQQLLSLQQLPPDIQGLFAFFLQQIANGPGQGAVKVRDPQTGRIGLVDAWTELYHPIMAILAVALEPLTVDQVHALINTLAERPQVVQAMDWLEQFFDRHSGTIRLYHATLVEFLTATGTRNDPATTGLYVDAVSEHLRLADLLEGQGWPEAIWQDCPEEPREQGRRDYARMHYIAHLSLGKDWARLYRVIVEQHYGSGKLRFDRSTLLYSRDLDTAIQAVTRRDQAERLAQLPRLWRYKLLRCSLSSSAEDLSPLSYRALALVGRDQEAADLAELIIDPQQQSLALAHIAAVRARRRPGAEEALLPARRAFEIALRIDEASARRAHLAHLLGVVPLLSQPVRAAAANLARSLPDARDRADALAYQTKALYRAGYESEAEALVDELYELVITRDDQEVGPVLQTYSVLCADLGAFKAAQEAAAGLIGEPMHQLEALISIAVSQQAAGMPEAAKATVAQAEALAEAAGGAARAHACVLLAKAEASLGATDRALSLLHEALDQVRQAQGNRAEGPPIPGEILSEIAGLAQQLGDAERFREAVDLLYDSAVANLAGRSTEPGDHVSHDFSLVVVLDGRALADLDQCDKALALAARLSASERYSIFEAVIASWIRQRDWDRALAVVERIRQASRESPFRVILTGSGSESYDAEQDGLIAIADGLARDGNWSRALEIAEQLSLADARVRALSQVAVLQAEAGLEQEASAMTERLMRQVRLRNTSAGRAESRRRTVELLVRARCWMEARALAQTIEEPYERSRARSVIARALIDSGQFGEAEAAIGETEDASVAAECLIHMARRLVETGSADNLAVIHLLRRARDRAHQEPNLVTRAAVLRNVAGAIAELNTGAVEPAYQTLSESVDALKHAPRFGFVPTPWCDTCVSYATHGWWDIAMKIAGVLVQHDTFDGASALRDLAQVARKRGDLARAADLLVQAKTSATRVAFPPLRSGLLASIAAEYVRMGQLGEAMKDDLVTSGFRQEILDSIAAVLSSAGQTEEAIRLITAPDGRLIGPRALPALVDAFLAAGDVPQALRMARLLDDPSQRAEKLTHIASALLASGQREPAQELIAEAVSLTGAFSNPKSVGDFLRNVAEKLEQAGETDAAVRLVEDRWLTAPTRTQLLDRLPVIEPIIPRLPQVALQIPSSFEWVEDMLVRV